MDEGRKLTDKELEKLEKELSDEYSRSERIVQRIMRKRIEYFNASNEKKLKQLAKEDITAEEYDEWLDKELNDSSWSNKAVEEGAKEQTKINQAAALLISASLLRVFHENSSYGRYQVEKSIGISTSYSIPTDRALERIIRKKPYLLPKPKVDIPKDRRWNERYLRRALIQGIKKGESAKKIATRLQKSGMVSVAIGDIKDKHLKTSEQIAKELARRNRIAALRNARTMITGAENMARLESYKEAQKQLGVKLLKVWSATMDDRTRDSHAFLDGVKVPLDEEFPNGCQAPGDASGPADEVWNCRCAMTVEIEGRERDMSNLEIRNTDHFNYDSYEEWKEAHL